MERKNKLIIAIMVVGAIGILAILWGSLLGGPNLADGERKILVLATDKHEQPGGGVDMAFFVELKDGSIKKYTPVYPGGMMHPTQAAPAHLSGKMFLHDSLWDGPEQGMQYAKEIVAANTGMEADAVVIVYDEGLDAVIDSIRPFKVDGEVSDLDATSIIRMNDNYAGYPGSSNVQGTMSRGDAVMVLARALSQAAVNVNKRNTMVQTALDEYAKGNILMTPEGSFMSLMATKGLEKLL
ncbi:MAG: DUF4012 domain-containing protein [Methanobrevibacter sp.]|nr:DUF4012 domain-containing protein [Methanobrevibacter sp.]